VASVLLALGFLADNHTNSMSQNLIDQHRHRLGQSMREPVWGEEAWLQVVPNDLRAANTRWVPKQGVIDCTSFQVYHDLLTDIKSPKVWLDQCVFYLASVEYDVGIFILTVVEHSSDPHVTCRRIRQDAGQHIVLVHTNRRQYGHYECVQYDGLRVFPTSHEFIQRLTLLTVTHPPAVMVEDDSERLEFIQRRQVQRSGCCRSRATRRHAKK
jgi:hypothetical protein